MSNGEGKNQLKPKEIFRSRSEDWNLVQRWRPYFYTGHVKTQTADCRLQTADCRLQTADCADHADYADYADW